jgi:hypothetical protein
MSVAAPSMPELTGLDPAMAMAVAAGAAGAVLLIFVARKVRKLLVFAVAGATALVWWLMQEPREVPFIG